ncbi:ribosome maturation factor RimP [Oscillospiraceae bacterium NSJ-54]|uniref:Ribosome maturation factor RimP n=2 Tax=Zongyangia hominis TaxID=2763677 RepID=A0A926EAX0_9FIRM|nr:ribosome maturation factor RimP [Zongyangia hominis]
MGLKLWDVRFEKEGAYWYLRIFIDKEGGVDIDDCERVSRGIDKLLDDADPIAQSYYLEVSSPGVERDLVKNWHFEQFLGHKINVRLIRPVDGCRDYTGELQSLENGVVTMTLENGAAFSFDKAGAAFIRLYDDFEMGGCGE